MEVNFIISGTTNVILRSIGIDEGGLSVANVPVYPNPATDFIRFNKSEIGCRYNVYTISGNLVLSGITEDMVSVSNLADGIYHIEILVDKPRVMKLVKQ